MTRITTPVQTEVHLQAGAVSGGHELRDWRLTVEDARSHTTLLEIRLDPAAFFDLLTSRYTDPVPATVYTDAPVGRYVEHWSGEFSTQHYGQDSALRAALKDAVAERGGEPTDWTATAPSRTNRGTWKVRLLRFHDQPVEV